MSISLAEVLLSLGGWRHCSLLSGAFSLGGRVPQPWTLPRARSAPNGDTRKVMRAPDSKKAEETGHEMNDRNEIAKKVGKCLLQHLP